MIGSKVPTFPHLTKTSYFARMNYQVQRGLRELLSRSSISKQQWDTILDFFDHHCAFCGKAHTGNKRTGIVPDHLIPASKYGELCLGNVAPACHDCNDQRGDRPWHAFLSRFPAPQRKKQIALIRRRDTVQTYPYEPISDPSQWLAPEMSF